MGFFDWLENLGGPQSICKIFLKIHADSIMKGQTHRQALYNCLDSRYRIIKTIHSDHFPAILETTNSIGGLAAICFIAENPKFGGDNSQIVIDKIINYLRKVAPAHAEEFYNEIMSAVTNFKQ